MILKKLTKEEKDVIVSTIDNQGFWYALTAGGYLSPEDILENKNEIDKINKATDIVSDFEDICSQL